MTTPVPPMPIMNTLASAGTRMVGSGSVRSSVKAWRSFFLGGPSGTTVRNDGQSPSRHE